MSGIDVGAYVAAGWPLLPLPAGQKASPPDDTTGQHGADLSLEDVVLLAGTHRGNWGIRMPDGVVGIDVDQYAEKRGAELLARLEGEHGPLPPGPWSSSRAWPSGIRFFRVPPGTRLVGAISGGIEIIQRHHRYAVAWPSVVEDRSYAWSTGAVPPVASLPELPAAWLTFLSKGASAASGPAAAPEVVTELEAQLFARAGACPELGDLLAHADAEMAATGEGGRHDAMLKLTFRLAHLCVEGHLSWWEGTQHLAGLWDQHVGQRWDEFGRMVRSALAKAGASESSRVDPCSIMSSFGTPAEPVATMIERANLVRAAGAGHNGLVLMAHRFAAEHAGHLMFVPKTGWHAWDGRRWAEETGQVYQAVHASLRTAYRKGADLDDEARKRLYAAAAKVDSGTDKMLKHASARPELLCPEPDLDADPYLLNVANGTLDLRTLELKPHDPADRITKVTTASYEGRGAAGGPWARFLDQVLPDPAVRDFLGRLVGMSLLGEVREHVLPILTGTGRNGKGVLYGSLLEALGDYAKTAEPELLLETRGGHPTGQMDLRGARLVVVSENDRNRQMAEATMKRLTGGDKIKARYMGGNFLEFTPSHLALMVTNHLPQVSGDDPAVWARLRVVPFDVVIPDAEQDPDLPGRIKRAALSEVLAWAVDGWADYQRHGLTAPAAVLRAGAEYRADSDPVGRWFEDECSTDDPNASCSTADAYQNYVRWHALEVGGTAPTQRAIGQELDRRGYPTSRSNGQRVRRGLSVAARSDYSWSVTP